MLRQTVLLSYLLGLCSRAIAADLSPIVTTITVPTTSKSLSTFTSAGVSTSVAQGGVMTLVTTVRNNVLTITSTLEDQTSVVPFTSTGVSTIVVNTNTIVVSTVGFSTATSSDDPATKTAVSASTSASSTSVTDAPSLTTSTSDTSTSSSETQPSSTQSKSQSSTISPSGITTKTSTTTSATASAAVHHPQPKGGLTTGQKAGIGVGAALGVVFILILVAVIILWRHGLLSRKSHAEDVFGENEDFLHRPYSMLFNQKKQIEVNHEKPEDTKHHLAYGPHARLSNPVDISGTTIYEHADEPVYLGVPTHMSGQKRWSKVPQREA